MALEEFFNKESEEDKNKLTPFNIYIMKLLYCKIDVLKSDFDILK
jgi:hypothetical protein